MVELQGRGHHPPPLTYLEVQKSYYHVTECGIWALVIIEAILGYLVYGYIIHSEF